MDYVTPLLPLNSAQVELLRRWLIDMIGYQAEWRVQKASAYPDDQRNQKSADALQRLSAGLNELPENHPLWARLQIVQDSSDTLGEIEHEYLRGYGFHSAGHDSAEEFLLEFVALLEQADKEGSRKN